MLEQFLTYIHEKNLFAPDDSILLAVSGGMDSVVMSHLFDHARFNFAITHCNFNLRGDESDEDELFVRKLAKKYKVPFYAESFDTAAFADTEKISIQMAARALRYRWFGQLLQSGKFAYVATAHHVNDVVETVLLNLTRGTGMAGLHGIAPKNGRIVRPLLFTRKEDFYAYVTEHQLVWREDSSNVSTKYQRNLIRHEVIPHLKTINPALETTMQQTIARVSAVERIFEVEIERLRQATIRETEQAVYIDTVLLQGEAEPVIKLCELLKPYFFSYGQTQEIWQSIDGEPGKQFHSPTHTLVKDRTELVITARRLDDFMSLPIEAGQETVQTDDFQLQLQTFPATNYRIPGSPDVAALDAQLLQFPLKLRKWKPGDWFCPLGMDNKKKISDFLIDEKVPLNLKDQVRVVISGQSLVWIIGYRIDNRFKITPKTEHILQITRQKNK